MSASFEEKSVWIQLVGVVVALGAYFVVAGLMLAHGITILVAYVPLFAVAVVLLVVILVGGHVVAALTGRSEPPDERDRMIEWRGGGGAATGVFAALGALVLSVEAVWVAHVLLLSLFMAEVARFGLQLVYYRRGV
jgi:hypothetical protein